MLASLTEGLSQRGANSSGSQAYSIHTCPSAQLLEDSVAATTCVFSGCRRPCTATSGSQAELREASVLELLELETSKLDGR